LPVEGININKKGLILCLIFPVELTLIYQKGLMGYKSPQYSKTQQKNDHSNLRTIALLA